VQDHEFMLVSGAVIFSLFRIVFTALEWVKTAPELGSVLHASPHQPIDLLTRNCGFCKRRVCAGGAGFRGDAAEQAHGCAVWAGAVAHALDA
jgi:hypothetical protein